jgi:hypothetical protein
VSTSRPADIPRPVSHPSGACLRPQNAAPDTCLRVLRSRDALRLRRALERTLELRDLLPP